MLSRLAVPANEMLGETVVPEQHRYDVFEHSIPMFEVVSDEQMQNPQLLSNDWNDTVELLELARGVAAATAAELVGGSARQIEAEVAREGAFCIGNLRESYEVRRASDEP
jgi:hypothetical protein